MRNTEAHILPHRLMAPWSNGMTRPFQGRNARFDPGWSHCGHSSTAERQIVDLLIGVRFPVVTPRSHSRAEKTTSPHGVNSGSTPGGIIARWRNGKRIGSNGVYAMACRNRVHKNNALFRHGDAEHTCRVRFSARAIKC